MTDKQNLKYYKFTNKEESPYLDTLLTMFYHAAMNARIGIMEAMDAETGKEVLVLVGITEQENGEVDCYPLARCLPAEEVGLYLQPDGKGNYIKSPETND